MACHTDLFFRKCLSIEILVELLKFKCVWQLLDFSIKNQEGHVIQPLMIQVELVMPDFTPLQKPFNRWQLINIFQK